MSLLDDLQPASIDVIRREDTSALYVLNNSVNQRTGGGLVIFNVAIDANERRIIRVPNTWIPVDIGQQIPRDLILRSPDFMDAVMRRTIYLVKSEDAESIFTEDEEARLERDKVYQDLSGTGRMSTDSETVVPASAMADVEGAIDPDINPQIAEAAARDDIPEQELMSLVRTKAMAQQLTAKDYDFILANTQYQRVRSFCTDQLAKLPRGQRMGLSRRPGIKPMGRQPRFVD